MTISARMLISQRMTVPIRLLIHGHALKDCKGPKVIRAYRVQMALTVKLLICTLNIPMMAARVLQPTTEKLPVPISDSM